MLPISTHSSGAPKSLILRCSSSNLISSVAAFLKCWPDLWKLIWLPSTNGQLINQTNQFQVSDFYYGYVSIPSKFDLRIIDTDYMNYLVKMVIRIWFGTVGSSLDRILNPNRFQYRSQLLSLQKSDLKHHHDHHLHSKEITLSLLPKGVVDMWHFNWGVIATGGGLDSPLFRPHHPAHSAQN